MRYDCLFDNGYAPRVTNYRCRLKALSVKAATNVTSFSADESVRPGTIARHNGKRAPGYRLCYILGSD